MTNEEQIDSRAIKLSGYWAAFGFISIVIGLICLFNVFNLSALIFPSLGKKVSWEKDQLNSLENAAQIGDLIGGIVGTIFAIGGTILIYATFSQQSENFKRERFESRFFELIKVYRECVEEMNIGDKVLGRKCFVSMFREFSFLYLLVKNVYEVNFSKENKKIFTEKELCSIAYKIFFFGIGYDSEKMYRSQLSSEELELFKLIRKELLHTQLVYWKETGENKSEERKLLIMDTETFRLVSQNVTENFWEEMAANEDKGIKYYEPQYFPFDGHTSRLGHYYRTLFQIVRFVVQHEGTILKHDECLDYLKILRTQMSNAEQLLLYYNGVIGFGEKWLNDIKNKNANYFIDYKMIHNVPFPLADFGIPIEKEFADLILKGMGVFEWEWSDN